MNILLFPVALVVMFGRMLRADCGMPGSSSAVMVTMLVGMIGWAIYWDTLQPNPGLTAHAGEPDRIRSPTRSAPGGQRRCHLAGVAGLPVDQELGNLEGKELRFGTSAGGDVGGASRWRAPTARSTACTTA